MYRPKTLLECKLCGDRIYSHYEGEYRECKCGKIAIDETELYRRCLGDSDNIIDSEIDERDFIWTTAEDVEIRIRDLSINHMENIILFLDNELDDLKQRYIGIGLEERAENIKHRYIYYAIKNEIELRNEENYNGAK